MVLDNFRTIELIWDKANKSIIKTIKTASSDTTGRYFSVKILDGGQEVILNNAKLQLYWEHPNFNTSGTDDFSTVNNGGLFKMTFSDEMLTNIGELNAHLVLTLTDGKITSDGFPIQVFKGTNGGVVVPANVDGLVKQIDAKIDKGNVTLGDLTQEVKLAMTGGSVAIVGENSVGTESVKDNSITPEKTSFVTILAGENTYDESTNSLDTGVSMETGVPFSTPRYDTTDYIPVRPSTKYMFSDVCRVAEYADKTAFVKGTIDVTTITTSSSTRFIRIMVLKTSVDFRFNEGTVLLPSGSTDPLLEIKNLELPKISVDKIEGLTGQGNLYDDTTSLVGYVQVSNTISANESYKLSDFIEVDENDEVTVSYARNVFASFFDKDKAYISSLKVADVTGVPSSEKFNLSFNPPPEAAFARFNIYLDNADNFMVVKNIEMPASYTPKTDPYIKGLGTKFKSLNLNHFDDNTIDTLTPDSKWLGKRGVTAGDSITWYDQKTFGSSHFNQGSTAKGYQTYMRDELGVTIDNIGASGNNLTEILGIIKAYNFTGVDFATITSGANDWSQEREIGSLALPQTTFDENTFYGALQSAVEFIINANSNTKIVLITPIRGYHPTSTHTGEWLTKGRLVNDMLEQPEDYANAIKEVAELYGLDYVDFRDFTGLNFLTKSLYLGDDPALTNGKLVHPNNIFYEKMGKYIVSQFKTFAI